MIGKKKILGTLYTKTLGGELNGVSYFDLATVKKYARRVSIR